MNTNSIIIRGAREHNLKNINLELPRNRLIVITGLSGSGKSSLAFDTLYAEGQRRYVESLSTYARQFLEQLQKPDVEAIEGLSPAIAIEQRSASSNPRSTVATTTEIYDYLRLLYARIGTPYCYKCGRLIQRQTSQQIINQVLSLNQGTPVLILAPLVRGRKGEFHQLFDQIRKDGFVRVRVDGVIHEATKQILLDKKRIHTIEVVVDRINLQESNKERIADSIETALRVGQGKVIINEQIFSEEYACIHCGISLGEISPRIFSFNSPYGACSQCDGLGNKMEIDPERVVPNPDLSIQEGAIEPWYRGGMQIILYYRRLLRQLARRCGFRLDIPFRGLPSKVRELVLYGSEANSMMGEVFEGVIPNLHRRFRQTESDYVKQEIAKYMSVLPCPVCKGARLKSEALSIKIAGNAIHELSALSISEAEKFFSKLSLTSYQEQIAQQVLREIRLRLQFLTNVGLDYLTLDRISSTLSGGEAQRIRLATQIGAGLVGVLYILDEPSIGLHQRDNDKLLTTLKVLRDLGNTLVVVEHDEATIRNADYIVDLGPGAGKHGGEIVACGTLEDVLSSPYSLTGQYLRGDLRISIPSKRRIPNQKRYLEIKKASEHNLKNINVKIPLSLFVCITGVSGSGKSTLVDQILYRALAKILYQSRDKPGKHEKIVGAGQLDKVIVIDQAPIGRTPRSNPATYTGVFTPVREFFTQLPEARVRGYRPGRFSFNVKGGRCEACQGDGIKKIEMHFLPDVYVSCEVCRGQRFNEQTLQILYKGQSISDVLKMTVEEARELFKNIPNIKEKLDVLHQVGLDYVELGQSATTLSGGEAQRIKLASELSKKATGRTLYILDEPTTGLHFADTEKLLRVLHTLVDSGNTVLVIEHNLDVVKTADYIIDLGPEGGDRGGWIVAEGTPEKVAGNSYSYTGQYLNKILEQQTVYYHAS